MTTMKIAIVEDEPDVLDGLVATVMGIGGYEVTLAAGTVSEASQYYAAHTTDILLTDLGLPDGDGVDLIRSVYDRSPDTLIMVLSAFGEEQRVVSAIMAGAKAYVLKSDDSHGLSQALQQLVAGGSPISASIARFLLVQLRESSGSSPASQSLLTQREAQVLDLIALGYRTAEIGERLFISYHTVVNHIRNVYDKLAVSSRSQAIHKASQLGLLKGR